MTNTRETLNKTAENLRMEHAYEGDNTAVFHSNIAGEVAKFNEYVKTPRTEEETIAALKPVKDAVALYNDEMRMLRLEELEGMKAKEAVAEYLRTQCVKGFAVKNDKKEGGWKVQATDKVEVDAYDFVSTICTADLNGIIDAACIFVDNVARWQFKTDGAYITRDALSKEYVSLRERKNWDIDIKKENLSTLAAQMTEICQTISFGVAPKMINPDVKYVMFSVIGTKNVADAAGRFVIRDEKTVVRAMFRAMWTRYNKKAYEFQTQTRAKDAPLTFAANKAMSESSQSEEFHSAPTAEGGEVTLGTAETGKKSGKVGGVTKVKESDKKSK